MPETSFPRIAIENIDKLSLSLKKGVVKISFEVMSPNPDILKLIYLQSMAQPLNIIIESPQSVMDLRIQEINTETGEVKE